MEFHKQINYAVFIYPNIANVISKINFFLRVATEQFIERRTSDEVDGLFEAVDVSVAVVLDPRTQLHPRDEVTGVDHVDGIQHGLRRLDTSLWHDLAADEQLVPFVNHHQPAYGDVAIDDGDVVLVRPYYPLPFRRPEHGLVFRYVVTRLNLRPGDRQRQRPQLPRFVGREDMTHR